MSVFRRKPCNRCGVEKVVSKCNFYRHPQMADGFLNICIPCKRRDIEENRELKADYYRNQERVRNARPDRVASRQAYAKTPRGKAARLRANRRYRRFKAMELRA